MEQATKLQTADDLRRMPGNGQYYEPVTGELRAMPPAGEAHDATTINLTVPRGHHADTNDQGIVVTILTDKDELDGEDVLPGFRLPVARVFRRFHALFGGERWAAAL